MVHFLGEKMTKEEYKEVVVDLYINQYRTISEISRITNTSRRTIRRLIEKLGLLKPTSKEEKINRIPKKDLIRLYCEENKTLQEIADLYNLKSKKYVSLSLKKHDIQLRQRTFNSTKQQESWIRYSHISKNNVVGGHYFAGIRYRARNKKLEFNLTKEYLTELFLSQNKLCAISQIPLVFKNVGENQTIQTASLDRIDSSKGYIEGNVQWVHKDINRMKSNFSYDKLVELCILVVK